MGFKVPWWLTLDWRHTKPLLCMCAFEFPVTVATLALFGIADPDTYRTALWTEGWRHGWNSNPIEILYSYANYRPMAPPTPWNQFVTDWNVVICVLSMFILLAKTVGYIIHVFPPAFSAVVHAALAAVYAVSISQQLGSDYSDPDHPSKVPWMFTYGCGDPVAPQLKGFCMQSQASLAVAVIQCALFLVYMSYSLVMAIPSEAQKEEAKREAEEAETEEFDAKHWEYELSRLPTTPATGRFPNSPTTPRTMAFNTLDGAMSQRTVNRDLPLRHHIGMGEETFKGTNEQV